MKPIRSASGAALAARASVLRGALADLVVRIEGARVDVVQVDVPSYPGGPRPTSLVTLEGHGHAGHGEHVGWTLAAHEAFRDRVATLAAPQITTIDELSSALRDRFAEPYDRAALEAAAIDLALRQARADLSGLLGLAPDPVRYVLSTDRLADPGTFVRAALAREPWLEFKLDADPAWTDEIYRDLASIGRVAVLDWKLSGDAEDHERAHRLLPDAWLEDPKPAPQGWSSSLAARLSIDAALTSARALDESTTPPPAAANIKPARLGGVLEALDALAAAARRGIEVYFGGMFEVDIGRRQLLALASLLSPEGPNDIAPISRAGEASPRPRRLVAASGPIGFG